MPGRARIYHFFGVNCKYQLLHLHHRTHQLLCCPSCAHSPCFHSLVKEVQAGPALSVKQDSGVVLTMPCLGPKVTESQNHLGWKRPPKITEPNL